MPPLEERLQALPNDDSPELDHLIANVQANQKRDVPVLIQLWQAGPPPVARRAGLVLSALEPDGAALLTASPLPRGLDERLFLVRLLRSQRLTRSRSALKERLTTLLGDRTPVPTPTLPGPAPEEKIPPHRLCDEAYLAALHQRFGFPKIHDGQEWLLEKEFLAKSDRDKDQTIADLRKSGAFR